MDWRQWFYIIYTILLAVLLYGFLIYLYGSKKRRKEIERTRDVLFTDEPVDPISDNSKP